MAEKQSLLSSFLAIAAGDQSPARATRYLETANWCLEDALELFFSGAAVGDPAASDDADNENPANEEGSFDRNDDSEEDEQEDDDDNYFYDDDDERPEECDSGVRHPPPVLRDVLSYNSSTRSQQQGGEEDADAMFAPQADMLFRGAFHDAKAAGVRMDRWLLVNVQSGRGQSSTLLNRDVWSDDLLADLIKRKFVFWQVDQAWPEGQKVCTYYNQNFLPAILVVDPITGKMMRSWTGVVEADDLFLNLLQLSQQSPREHLVATSRKRQSEATPPPTTTPPPPTPPPPPPPPRQMYERLTLPKEPENGEGVCRVGVRLPDGRRVQRRFLQGDSIKMLWSFCLQHLEEEAAVRGFHFIVAVPGNSKRLEYDCDLSFTEAAVSNTLISLVRD